MPFCSRAASARLPGMKIDWELCEDVERVPGKVSGALIVKGTRIPVEAVLENATDYTPEQIVAEIYPSLPLERARRIIAFARAHEPAAG
jgi:uncharacterized protein (DUF433 family)